MPVRLQVRLSGDGDLLARFGTLRKELERERRKTMLRAVILLRDTAKAMLHSPEGKARRGIRSDVRSAGESLQGLVRTRNAAAVFSQRTRNPGKPMPPVKAIMRWLKRTNQVHSRSSAFLVARAIAKKGTVGRPVMGRTLEAKRNEVLALFKEMILKALEKH